MSAIGKFIPKSGAECRMNVKQSKLEKASRDKAKGKYKNLLRVNADRKLIHSG
ncbi:hypothetical protein ACSZNE_21125 [Aeromonas caviae]|uniref:hypothetical protein n=1 Tax=Aeromonas caviae TaxID=648 RepID=UPI003EC7BAD3